MQKQVYVVEEVMIRSSVDIDEISEILPAKTANLGNSSRKEQSLRPIDFSLESIFLHVQMHQEDACTKDKRHNIPMIFFLSYFLLVVEDMKADIERKICVVVVIDEPVAAVLQDEIDSLIIVDAEHDPGVGLASIQLHLMDGQGHPHRLFALELLLLIPLGLPHSLHKDLTISAIGQASDVGLYLHGGSSRGDGHLIKIHPPFVSSEKTELKLGLEYPS